MASLLDVATDAGRKASEKVLSDAGVTGAVAVTKSVLGDITVPGTDWTLVDDAGLRAAVISGAHGAAAAWALRHPEVGVWVTDASAIQEARSDGLRGSMLPLIAEAANLAQAGQLAGASEVLGRAGRPATATLPQVLGVYQYLGRPAWRASIFVGEAGGVDSGIPWIRPQTLAALYAAADVVAVFLRAQGAAVDTWGHALPAAPAVAATQLVATASSYTAQAGATEEQQGQFSAQQPPQTPQTGATSGVGVGGLGLLGLLWWMLR
jgi:hypothetical protein